MAPSYILFPRNPER